MAESSFRNAKSRDAMLIAYKALADLAAKGSLFVVTVVAARRLSQESFGIFALGSTLGWIMAVAADCGIQLHLARAVARAPADAASLLGAWLRVRLGSSAAAILILVVGLAMWGWPATYAVPIGVLALVYTCSGLIEFLHYFYRGLSRSDVESSLTLWQRGGTLAFGLAALAWRPDVTVLAVAMLLPVVATLVASLRIAARFARSSRPEELVNTSRSCGIPLQPDPSGVRLQPDPTGSPNGGRHVGQPLNDTSTADFQVHPVAAFRRDVLPIGAGIVLSALYFRIDVFLVQLWSGTEAVARYNAVFRMVEALRLFPAAVLAVALPALCRAHNLRPVARLSAGLLAFAVAASAVLWITAPWLIRLVYGAQYDAAVPAFRVLLLSFPLLALNYALTHQLVGWDGQRAYAVLCGLALVVNVALNARLIPAWSIEGAAWATLGTEVFLTGGCLVALRDDRRGRG